MAVSKRLRFEILRRDNHTCYYCGRKPPEVEITIDHVLPQALGGTDEASNLVAACRECNGGKTSVAPDSPLVAQVDADAARWSAAMQVAIAKASEDHQAVSDYRQRFVEAWDGYQPAAPLSENWRFSVENFRARGLPIEVLIEAVHTAMGVGYIKQYDKFKYLCGIAWKRIEKIELAAREQFAGGRSPAAGEEWVEPSQTPVVEAAVAVWISVWGERYAEDPPADLELEVRDQAMTLYPEYIGADELMQTVQTAAWQKSSDLSQWAMDGSPEARVQQIAAWFFYGWVGHSGQSDAPSPAHWKALVSSAFFAFALGYSSDTVTESAYRAGCGGEYTVEPYLLTFATAARDEEEEISGLDVDKAQINAWMEIGRQMTERFSRSRKYGV